MIELLPQSSQTCLAVHFSGKVDGQEYQQFLDAIENRLKDHDRLNLVVDLRDFNFYGDIEAARKDIKFGIGEYKHINRAAFVGNQKWIEWFTRLIGPFTHAEEKHFPEGQLEEAINWVNA